MNQSCKTVRRLLIILLSFTLLNFLPVAAQDTGVINPLTGITAENPELLTVPPFLIPISRYPDQYRPSAGLSQASWVFEMYVNAGESRPYALYFGKIPEATTGIVPYIGALSSAILGAESLRKQYQAVLVTAGNAELVVENGLLNVENWYGESGKDKYPNLAVQRLSGFMQKWKSRLSAPDLENIAIPFSCALPTEGKAGQTVFVRYADFNQILWEFDAADGLYHRSQNSNSDPAIVKDMDILTNSQIAVQNLIILMADHSMLEDDVNFTVNFNFVEKNPAIIFRDGIRFDLFWTTKSGAYERTTEKMRPIRFFSAEGEPFPLKPGQSWVHVFQPENPNYEISEPGSSQREPGSGHWKFPYISIKPEEKQLNPIP